MIKIYGNTTYAEDFRFKIRYFNSHLRRNMIENYYGCSYKVKNSLNKLKVLM